MLLQFLILIFIYIDDVVSQEDPSQVFTVHEVIGSGASGIVYRATSNKDRKEMAIKQMNLEQQSNKKIVLNEIRIMREIHHENIANLLGSYFKDGIVWV